MHKAFKQNNVTIIRLVKYFIYGLWELVFYLLPYSPLRIMWLRLGGANLGRNCVIDRINFINLDRSGLKGLKMGADCYLGSGVLLDLAGQIILKDQVTIASRSIILSHHSVGFSDHPLIKIYPKKICQTVLNSGSVIGVNSVILPGVTIGENSLVAAGAVVNKSVPSSKMAAGVPAQIKKSLHEKKS